MRRLRTLTLVFLLPMAACHSSQPADHSNMQEITGQGRLLSVDQTLGIGTLDIKGKSVTFWWKNQSTTPGLSYHAYSDPTGKIHTLSPAPDDEADPQSRHSPIPFDAQVGDTIYFHGLQTGSEIFITTAVTQKEAG